MIIREGTELFARPSVRNRVREREHELAEFVATLGEPRVLNGNINNLFEQVAERFSFKVPELSLDETTQEATDNAVVERPRRVPARQFLFEDTPTTRQIKGSRIRFHIPFIGDRELFSLTPSIFTTVFPQAAVGDDVVVLSYFLVGADEAELKSQFEKDVAEIRTWLGWVRTEVSRFNEALRGRVEALLSERRARIESLTKMGAAMGFPLRRRGDAPKTYAVPTVRRKPPSERPHQPGRPEPLEPTIDLEEYEFILTVVRNMVTVMERSPRAFETMREEDLRQHILVQLNGQYEGTATGETFNFEGRTDILMRVEGRNIFIAECKFWDGPASLVRAIDQLLSYASWRDTKTAILVFNRGRKFSDVISAIPVAARSHSNFKRELNCPHETSFRCILGHRDDPRRELVLTIMAFDVPSRDKQVREH